MHADVDASTYLPGMQSEQYPSAEPPHACRAPAGQLLQSVHVVWPTEGWKDPAAHSVQALAAETCDDVPTAHSVQVLAPGSLPVLVTEPAAHTVHAATSDTAENSPAAHAVQVVAPTAEPVSVIEPAWQPVQ